MTPSIPPSSVLPIQSITPSSGGHGDSTSATTGAVPSTPVAPASSVSQTASLAPIVQAMQTALANTVDLSPQAQQAIKLEAFAKLVQQLVSQVQPTKVDMPASWPAGGVTPQMQQLLSALLQQFTAQQPLPQQLVSVQSWSAQLTQAVLQHAGASVATAQASTAAGSAAANSAQRPVGSAPLPQLQNWLVQQGSIQAADGERGFTLTLRVPAAWAQAQSTLAAALPGGASIAGAQQLGNALLPLPFAGSVQQLASGSFGLVMQPQAVPGSAAAVAAQAMRTSAILQLEFQPLAQAAAAAPAAAIYMPAYLSQQEVQAMLQGRGQDPWLLMLQAEADGTNQPRQRKNGNEQAGLCNRAGCQYQGRATCAQPFCAEMNYLWSVARAQRR